MALRDFARRRFRSVRIQPFSFFSLSLFPIALNTRSKKKGVSEVEVFPHPSHASL
jgi:hypothetical protein